MYRFVGSPGRSGSVRVQQEPGERAVLVVVAAVRFPAVQLDVDLVPGVQVQHGAVGGVVVVLVRVLGDGAGAHLHTSTRTVTGAPKTLTRNMHRFG